MNESVVQSHKPYILIGCSLVIQESIALIIFAVKAFWLKSDYTIRIVIHPLANYDYLNLINELELPPYIQISKIGFSNELKKSSFILYDASTVGLEGLMNGVQPVYIGHENAIQVNPNDFEKKYTNYTYEPDELGKNIEQEVFNPNTDWIEAGNKYFGSDSELSANEIVQELLHSN